ncbi:MAG: AraC family transcriptional regulator [Calditrichaeota bacterium]|nr:AraC family transcriptional regulator [Calditrichota bacterium]
MNSISIQTSDLLILSGVFVAVLIAFAYAFHINKQVANIWLVAFMLASIAVLIVKFLYHSSYITEFPHWFKVNIPIGISRPLLIYLYIYFLVNSVTDFSWKQLLHFVPILLLTLYFMPFYLQSADYKLSVLYREIDNQLGTIPYEFVFVQYAYSFIYSLLSVYELKRFRSRAKNLTANQNASIHWLYLLIGAGLLYLLSAVIIRLLGLNTLYNYELSQIYSVLLLLFCLKILTLPVINQIDLSEPQKYRKSNLSGVEKTTYMKRIDDLMKTTKLFKQDDLKLSDISKTLGLPNYQLSQVINEEKQQSFRDYLNEYRIAEALKLLETENQNYTIDAIAYESGFKSRSAFYTAFKKNMLITPTEYLARKSV